MIHLTKTAEPDILKANSARWTAELLAAQQSGGRATEVQKNRYRHSEIKDALIRETHGKCAYCESKVRHVAPGDIEHITAKSISPNLAFKWENLTLACPVCNNNKSDYAGDHGAIVDPYLVEPSLHLIFDGSYVWPVPGSASGQATELVLKLNRAELVERRQKRLKALHDQLTVLANAKDSGVREILRRDLLEHETSNSQEYAALSRKWIALVLAIVESTAAVHA